MADIIWKASVKDKSTGRTTLIESEYPQSTGRSSFIKDLRNNGYTVSRVEPKEVFDFVTNNTRSGGEKWEWQSAKKIYESELPLNKDIFRMVNDDRMSIDEVRAAISQTRGFGSTSESGTR